MSNWSASRRLALVAAVYGAFAAGPAGATWLPQGNWISPDAYPHQRQGSLCSDGTGGSYFIWHQENLQQDGDAYVQHIDGLGNVATGWPSVGRALGSGPGTQFASHIESDMLGGVFAVWWNNTISPLQVRLQRLLANGTIAPGWPADGLVLPANSMDGLCGDGQGGVYLAWTSSDYRLWMIHYGADGQVAPGWSTVPRRIVPTTSAQFDARIYPAADGGFLATWCESRAGGRIIALKVLPSGDPDPAWPPDGRVVNTIPTIQQYVSRTPDGEGGLFVAWSDYRNGEHPQHPYFYQVYAQHVLANGTIDPNWPVDGRPIVTGAPHQYSQYAVTMVADGSGGVHVVWKSGAIHALHVLNDGTIPPGWPSLGLYVVFDTEAVWWLPCVADGLGGVYILSSPGGPSVLAHHLTATGSTAPGWPSTGRVVAQGSVGGYREKVAVEDGQGGFVVGFYHGTSTSSRILAQRVSADGPVSTGIAFVDAELEPGRVRLRWSSADAPLTLATVHRRQGGEPWVERGPATSFGDGLLEFREAGLDPGRYDYRLGVLEDGTMTYVGETTVDIPSEFSLALAGFSPNPATGPPLVDFTLPSSGEARVDVYDVRGRLVASKAVAGLGRHRIDLGGDVTAPGMYWIRLEQDGHIRRSRGVVLR